MSNIKIVINTKNEIGLPLGRRFGYLLHDYDLYNLSRPSLRDAPKRTEGLPETVKVLNSRFMPMTKEWQLYWADLFSLSIFQTKYSNLIGTQRILIKTAFASVTKGNRAFTNFHGWDDGYQDYINNVNPGKTPMSQETISTGGNIVEILGNEERLAGKYVFKVATLDGNKAPPDANEVNHIKTPWLVFKATISVRRFYNENTKLWGREDIVIPFDQLQSNDVPIPFMGDGIENYIESNRIRLLPEGSILPETYVK